MPTFQFLKLEAGCRAQSGTTPKLKSVFGLLQGIDADLSKPQKDLRHFHHNRGQKDIEHRLKVSVLQIAD